MAVPNSWGSKTRRPCGRGVSNPVSLSIGVHPVVSVDLARGIGVKMDSAVVSDRLPGGHHAHRGLGPATPLRTFVPAPRPKSHHEVACRCRMSARSVGSSLSLSREPHHIGRRPCTDPSDLTMGETISASGALRVAMIAPISWRVPPRTLRAVGALCVPAHRGPGEARGLDVDALCDGGLDHVGSARERCPDRIFGERLTRRPCLGVTAHRCCFRAGRGVRSDSQQPRLSAADLQPIDRHPDGHHDPRLRL